MVALWNKLNLDNSKSNAPFKISILNVGKADCILIEIYNKLIIIDAGKSKSYYIIYNELKRRKIQKIDYLIISHLDKDHIGGIPNLLEDYSVENIIQADYKKENDQYYEYIKSIKKHKVEVELLHENKDIYIKDVEIRVYPGENNEYKHSNDYSLIVDINYNEKNFLFMGDAEKVRLSEFINKNKKKYNFIKMPHHGRIDDMTEKFVRTTLPEYVAITCSKESGVDNEVKDILIALKIESFLSCNGVIEVCSNGKEIEYNQYLL